MSRFARNIDSKGRLIRGVGGLALLSAGLLTVSEVTWLGIVLLGSAAVALFEALRGWCALRACGIKTKF